MAEIGIRELRIHLSRYLDRVEGGEEVADLVVVAGDRQLLGAARSIGLAVIDIS